MEHLITFVFLEWRSLGPARYGQTVRGLLQLVVDVNYIVRIYLCCESSYFCFRIRLFSWLCFGRQTHWMLISVIVSISVSNCMFEMNTSQAMTWESELVPFIGSILKVLSRWMVFLFGLNRIRVDRFVLSSSNVGMLDSESVYGTGHAIAIRMCVGRWISWFRNFATVWRMAWIRLSPRLLSLWSFDIDLEALDVTQRISVHVLVS